MPELLQLFAGEPGGAAREGQCVRPVAGQFVTLFGEPAELVEVVLEPLALQVVEERPEFGALLAAARPAEVATPCPPPPFLATGQLGDVLDEPEPRQLPQVVAGRAGADRCADVKRLKWTQAYQIGWSLNFRSVCADGRT